MTNIAFCLVLCAAAAGCSRSDSLSDGRADVKITFSPGYMSSDDPNALEAEGINTLRIIVWNAEKGNVRNIYRNINAQTRPSLSEGINIYDLPTGQTVFYAIINEESIGKEYTDEYIAQELASSGGGIEDLLITDAGNIYFPQPAASVGEHGLPMSGKLETNLTENCAVSIPVTRAVAKLNLIISNGTADQIVVTNITYGDTETDTGFSSDRAWLFEGHAGIPDESRYRLLDFGSGNDLRFVIPSSTDATHVSYIYPTGNIPENAYKLRIKTEGNAGYYGPESMKGEAGDIGTIGRNEQLNIYAYISSESTVKIEFEVSSWEDRTINVPEFYNKGGKQL